MSTWDFLYYEWLITVKHFTVKRFAKLTCIQLSQLKKEYALYLDEMRANNAKQN